MADLGLDWITDELMTVKRARRLYISLIISAWRRRGVSWEERGCRELTPMQSASKKGDRCAHEGQAIPSLSHPLEAF